MLSSLAMILIFQVAATFFSLRKLVAKLLVFPGGDLSMILVAFLKSKPVVAHVTPGAGLTQFDSAKLNDIPLDRAGLCHHPARLSSRVEACP